MPGQKTSELPIAVAPVAGDYIPMYRSSGATLPTRNVRISTANLLAAASGFTPILSSEIPAAVAAGANLNLHDTLVYLFNHLGTGTPGTPAPPAPTGLSAVGRTAGFDLASGRTASDYEFDFV